MRITGNMVNINPFLQKRIPSLVKRQSKNAAYVVFRWQWLEKTAHLKIDPFALCMTDDDNREGNVI